MLKPDREGWWLVTFQICFLGGRRLPCWLTLPSTAGASSAGGEPNCDFRPFLRFFPFKGLSWGRLYSLPTNLPLSAPAPRPSRTRGTCVRRTAAASPDRGMLSTVFVIIRVSVSPSETEAEDPLILSWNRHENLSPEVIIGSTVPTLTPKTFKSVIASSLQEATELQALSNNKEL